ncbi:MAG: ATP-binding cassette domain-containing protein [Ruminococcus flavefaciens]|nr:ATP-binding cassette domain-containing protein [Ruminococcus flavefaciens]
MIDFQNVCVTFRQNRKTVEAVKNVSFQINDGDIFGIVGGSGAGKSTLLRTINQLQKISDGNVLVDGKAVNNLKGTELRLLRQNIGMIFQHFNLAENKTVYQNIEFVLKVAGWKKDKIKSRIAELLEFVKLSDKADVYPSKLSGGQKQRVSIARALANHTKILLCDEPTSALDAETTSSVLELLKQVNRDFGVTIVIITHELDVVKSICNKVVVMSDGKIVENGDVYTVFTNPQNDFTKQLIDHTNNFDIPKEITDIIKGPVLKLTYLGENAVDSVLSDTAEEFNVRYNIIHGKIEYIDSKPLGILYVNIVGEDKNIKLAVTALKNKTFSTEVVYNA